MPSVLLIEDNKIVQKSIKEALKAEGFNVEGVVNGKTAIEKFKENEFNVVLSDLKLPGISGLELIDELKALNPDIPIIIITAFASIDTAVEAMKKGAYDYIEKTNLSKIGSIIKNAVEKSNLIKENEYLKAKIADIQEHKFILGKNEEIKKIDEQIKIIAPTDTTILISGESGTGKEVIAREIFRQSLRNNAPFLAVNCAALSAGLLESELFGHEKGAFTGANTSRKGRFELANNGTILLDEVSEIDLNLQAKLLRVLQEKTFERVGSSSSRNTNARIIATTNRDLITEVQNNKFRKDLFFRLNVIPIHVPPLRERKDDINELAHYFIDKLNTKFGRKTPHLNKDVLTLLQNYDWPGNVRELANIIERAYVLSINLNKITKEIISPWLNLSSKSNSNNNLNFEPGKTISDFEKDIILSAMKYYKNNKKQTAAELGISERTLRDKLKKWNIE